MCVFFYLLAVMVWMDISGCMKGMCSEPLYPLLSRDCKTLSLIKFCKFWSLDLPNILKSLDELMLSVSNFRNITYLNPRKHRHIPKAPDGVLMPKKVGDTDFS